MEKSYKRRKLQSQMKEWTIRSVGGLGACCLLIHVIAARVFTKLASSKRGRWRTQVDKTLMPKMASSMAL